MILKLVCFRDFAKMSSRLVSNWIITVAIAQIPEGMLTNLNDLYYEGTQGYYDVSRRYSYVIGKLLLFSKTTSKLHLR